MNVNQRYEYQHPRLSYAEPIESETEDHEIDNTDSRQSHSQTNTSINTNTTLHTRTSTGTSTRSSARSTARSTATVANVNDNDDYIDID